MRLGGIALAVLVVVGSAACGSDNADDPPVTKVAGIPVLDGYTSGPGSDLGDGFTVVDGSVLLGDVVPSGIAVKYKGVNIEDRGWRALLLVTGDAMAVLDGYSRQAADVGLRVTDRYGQDRCLDDRGPLVTCARRGQVGGLQDGRSVDLQLQRAEGRGDRPPLSHLTIQYTETGEPPYPPVSTDACRGSVCPTVVPPPAPTDWPPLPEVGEPYEAPGNQPAGRVEPGSHLVAYPPSPFGTWSLALIVVTGDPDEVLVRYVHQQESDRVFEDRREDDGATVLERSWHAGGGEYGASVVLRDGRPTYLLIEHYGTD